MSLLWEAFTEVKVLLQGVHTRRQAKTHAYVNIPIPVLTEKGRLFNESRSIGCTHELDQ